MHIGSKFTIDNPKNFGQIYSSQGNSCDSVVQYLWTHFPEGVFAISSPALIGELHSEQVVLNFAFMIIESIGDR